MKKLSISKRLGALAMLAVGLAVWVVVEGQPKKPEFSKR